jgi:hypothetical protein
VARPTPPTLTPYVNRRDGGTRKLEAANLNGDSAALLAHTEAALDYSEELAGETFRAKGTESSLRAAIAAADGNNGGKVEAHAIGYDLTETLHLPSNVWLDLGGYTVLRQANGANLDVLVASDGWEDLVGTDTHEGVSRSLLTNGIIDGNYENNLTGPTLGLGMYGHGFDLDQLRIRFCRRLGLHTEWGLNPGGGAYDPTKSPINDRDPATEGFITRIRISDCIEGGWYFNGPNDPIMDFFMLVRNGHMGNPAFPVAPGFNIKLGPAALAPVFGMAHLWGNCFYHLEMADSQGGEFHGWQIEGGGNTDGDGGCVYFAAPGAKFIGGRIFTGPAGQGWLDSANGIVFGPGSFNLHLEGLTFEYCRPALKFTEDGGVDGLGSGDNSMLRFTYAANSGDMIAGDPGGGIVWDVHDATWDTGTVNLPSTARRALYGTEADQTALDA